MEVLLHRRQNVIDALLAVGRTQVPCAGSRNRRSVSLRRVVDVSYRVVDKVLVDDRKDVVHAV